MRKCCMNFYFFSHWFIFPYWKKSRAVEVGGDGGGAASQAVPGGVLMSKRVSESHCYYRTAALSKSLSVGPVDQKQKWAQSGADTGLKPSQFSSVHHDDRANTLNYSRIPTLTWKKKVTLLWKDNGHSFRFSHTVSSEMFKTEWRAALNAEASFWSKEWTDEKQVQLRPFSISARCMLMLTLMVITGLRIHLSY